MEDYSNEDSMIRKRGRQKLSDKIWKKVSKEENEQLRKQNLDTFEQFAQPQKRVKTQQQPKINKANNNNQNDITLQIHQVQQQPIYTKERIESLIRKYENDYYEYCNIRITYTIKHYIKQIPIICKKINNLKISIEQKEMILLETAKTLMLDEFEIIHWVKYIQRFDFKDESFALEVFFIGLATKILVNTQQIKEPIEVYLSKIHNQFYTFNQWVPFNNAKFYQDRQDALISHQIFLKLQQGLQPKIEIPILELAENRYQDFNEIVNELCQSISPKKELSLELVKSNSQSSFPKLSRQVSEQQEKQVQQPNENQINQKTIQQNTHLNIQASPLLSMLKNQLKSQWPQLQTPFEIDQFRTDLLRTDSLHLDRKQSIDNESEYQFELGQSFNLFLNTGLGNQNQQGNEMLQFGNQELAEYQFDDYDFEDIKNTLTKK